MEETKQDDNPDGFFADKDTSEPADKSNDVIVGRDGTEFKEVEGKLVAIKASENKPPKTEKKDEKVEDTDTFDYTQYDKIAPKLNAATPSANTQNQTIDPKTFEVSDDDDIQTLALKTAQKVSYELEKRQRAEIAELRTRLDKRDSNDNTNQAAQAMEKINKHFSESGVDPAKMFAAVDKYFRALPEDHQALLRKTYPDPYERVMFVRETMDRKIERTFEQGVKYATDLAKQKIAAPSSKQKSTDVVTDVDDLTSKQFAALDRDMMEGIKRPLQYYATIH